MSTFRKCDWCHAGQGLTIHRHPDSRLHYAIALPHGGYLHFPGGHRDDKLRYPYSQEQPEVIEIAFYTDPRIGGQSLLCQSCGKRFTAARNPKRERPNRNRKKVERLAGLPTLFNLEEAADGSG